MAQQTVYKSDTSPLSSPLRTLVGSLERCRTQRGLSVPQFAEFLGISYAQLSALRRFSRRPGGKSLSAIMLALPELTLLVMSYVQNGDTSKGCRIQGEGATPPALPRRSACGK